MKLLGKVFILLLLCVQIEVSNNKIELQTLENIHAAKLRNIQKGRIIKTPTGMNNGKIFRVKL